MKQLLEQIVKGIVNNPDAVGVEERESVDFPGLTILEISVDTTDKGILIGRRGRTINAIRDIMTISAIRNDKRIKVLVKDDRGPEGESHQRREDRRSEGENETPEPGNSMADEESESMLSDEL